MQVKFGTIVKEVFINVLQMLKNIFSMLLVLILNQQFQNRQFARCTSTKFIKLCNWLVGWMDW